MKSLMGSDEKSYAMLPSFAYMLENCNSGSIGWSSDETTSKARIEGGILKILMSGTAFCVNLVYGFLSK